MTNDGRDPRNAAGQIRYCWPGEAKCFCDTDNDCYALEGYVACTPRTSATATTSTTTTTTTRRRDSGVTDTGATGRRQDRAWRPTRGTADSGVTPTRPALDPDPDPSTPTPTPAPTAAGRGHGHRHDDAVDRAAGLPGRRGLRRDGHGRARGA
ncbi:MAG: hypothetical protein IPN17_27535 [Deltaproteobacteria bacterium]|nr:hypothetical protein [Deltaproteobacteria bacterium]